MSNVLGALSEPDQPRLVLARLLRFRLVRSRMYVKYSKYSKLSKPKRLCG